MGKIGGSSWLTAVKRAFRLPPKDPEKKNNEGPKHEHEQKVEEKRREKRSRWPFRRALSVQNKQRSRPLARESAGTTAEQKHAMATAVATEGAIPTVTAAAVDVACLIRPSSTSLREIRAAVVIQTAFRGYLARRALRALKGLVKLQALVRGHNVRKQAHATLRCMQALVRVQTRARDRRIRFSQEAPSAISSSSYDSQWQSRQLQDLSEQTSMPSRDGGSVADLLDNRSCSLEELRKVLQSRKDAVLNLERDITHSSSSERWRSALGNISSSLSIGKEENGEEEQRSSKLLERWSASRPSCDNNSKANRGHHSNRGRRASTDHRDPIKTIEIDTGRPFSCISPLSSRPPHPSSPLHRSHHHSSTAPSPGKIRSSQLRSTTPPPGREERSYSFARIAGSDYSYLRNDGYRHHYHRQQARHVLVPNYMATTESAKARRRSQSAPRQRPSTPERDSGCGWAKKRPSFPVSPNPLSVGGPGVRYDPKSPSLKSAKGRFRVEERSNVSSSCTESFAGEVSPSSTRTTTDLCRWVRPHGVVDVGI